MAFSLPRLQRTVAIVAGSMPSVAFQRWWQGVVEAIEAQEAAQDETLTAIEAAQADIVATQGDLAATQAALTATQADLTTALADIAGIQGDLTGFVAKDQTPAWGAPSGLLSRAAYAAYAGQVVSNPPTQSEMQALDNAVRNLSQVVVGLITDLKANGVLT